MYALLARENNWTFAYIRSLTFLEQHLALYKLLELMALEAGAESDSDGSGSDDADWDNVPLTDTSRIASWMPPPQDRVIGL